MAHSVLTSDEQVVIESPGTVYYRRFDNDENARGTLFPLRNNSIVFVTRRLLVFGYERHPEYDLSQILKVEPYSDGFKTQVLFHGTDDEPEEVIGYFCEIDGSQVDRRLAALMKPEKSKMTEPEPQPAQPAIVREREVIREIVKVKCSHCGNLYDQIEDKCPYCRGR